MIDYVGYCEVGVMVGLMTWIIINHQCDPERCCREC